MNRLLQANQSLYRLTIQTSHLAAHQTSSRSDLQIVPSYKIVRDRAKRFHLALSKGWNCPCQAEHSISLRLESRTESISSDDEVDKEPLRHPFRFLFRYDQDHAPTVSVMKPWTWGEADIRIKIESQTSPAALINPIYSKQGVRFAKQAIPTAVQATLEPQRKLQPIQDLCLAIGAMQKPERDVCFSLLAKELREKQRGILLITPVKQLPTDSSSRSVSSLRVVLEDPNFVQQDRLKLAIILASSVLQLHETPWLEQNGEKVASFFINRPGERSYGHPFVSQHPNEASTPTLAHQMSCVIRNQTLYALGVALVELYYRKPIVDLYQETDGPRNTGNAFFDLMTEFRTADRLAESLLIEAGARYSDAVRRCIRCDFDQRASSLNDTKFQRAVDHGVVVQLRENYEYLFQNSLIDTYGFG
jgi:hypothetical protein